MKTKLLWRSIFATFIVYLLIILSVFERLSDILYIKILGYIGIIFTFFLLLFIINKHFLNKK